MAIYIDNNGNDGSLPLYGRNTQITVLSSGTSGVVPLGSGGGIVHVYRTGGTNTGTSTVGVSYTTGTYSSAVAQIPIARNDEIFFGVERDAQSWLHVTKAGSDVVTVVVFKD